MLSRQFLTLCVAFAAGAGAGAAVSAAAGHERQGQRAEEHRATDGERSEPKKILWSQAVNCVECFEIDLDSIGIQVGRPAGVGSVWDPM